MMNLIDLRGELVLQHRFSLRISAPPRLRGETRSSDLNAPGELDYFWETDPGDLADPVDVR